MDTRVFTQESVNLTALLTHERKALVQRLAHAKVRFAQCDLDVTMYRPPAGSIQISVELDRFRLALERDLALETIDSLNDRIANLEEEMRLEGLT